MSESNPPAPVPEDIITVRKKIKLTQEEAGAVIYKSMRTWRQYEAGDREMDPALFELFLLKTGNMELKIISKK